MIKDKITENKEYNKLVKQFDLIDFSQYNQYGVVTKQNLYIPKKEKLQQFNEIKNIKYAIDDYKNLINEIKDKSNLNKISKISKFHISNISTENDYHDIVDRYNIYLFSTMMSFLDSKKIRYTNFNLFFKSFSKHIIENNLLFSFVSFLKSNYMSIFSSGLAFRVSDIKEINLKNSKEFILDDSFISFQEICLHNNFLIDKYMPWVIVRRVDEGIISENIDLYINVYDKELDIIYESVKEIYLQYVSNVLSEQERELVDIDQLSINFDEFLEFYIITKFKENKISFVQNDISMFKRFFVLNSKHNSVEDSVRKLNQISSEKCDSIYKDGREVYYR